MKVHCWACRLVRVLEGPSSPFALHRDQAASVVVAESDPSTEFPPDPALYPEHFQRQAETRPSANTFCPPLCVHARRTTWAWREAHRRFSPASSSLEPTFDSRIVRTELRLVEAEGRRTSCRDRVVVAAVLAMAGGLVEEDTLEAVAVFEHTSCPSSCAATDNTSCNIESIRSSTRAHSSNSEQHKRQLRLLLDHRQ